MQCDQERRQLRGLANLAASVAHKMNNDLAAITCNLGMLLDDFSKGIPPDDAHDLIADALSAAMHASRLAQEAFSLLRVGDEECDALNLTGVLDAACQPSIEQAPATIHFDVCMTGGALSIHSTFGRLQRMVAPLILNAIESMGESEGTVFVELTASDGPEQRTLDVLGEGRYAVITVRDEGPGFDPARGSSVFEPFFSTKGTERGLGLWTALALARIHGGSMGYANPEHGGAAISLWLPTVDPA